MLTPTHQRAWAAHAAAELGRTDTSQLDRILATDNVPRFTPWSTRSTWQRIVRNGERGRGSVPFDWQGPAGQ